MENRLKERREALGLSQADVSKKLRRVEPRADVGMVSRYENGVCLPTRPQMEALEQTLQACRIDLYDDLADLVLIPDEIMYPIPAKYMYSIPPRKPTHETRQGVRTMRKCFRMARSFAETLPEDLLEACGYTSWQSWYDAAIKRLLGEYAARKKAASRGANTRSGEVKNDTLTIHHPGGKVNGPHAER